MVICGDGNDKDMQGGLLPNRNSGWKEIRRWEKLELLKCVEWHIAVKFVAKKSQGN